MAMGIGPIPLGYCYEPVDSAVKAQIDKGVLGSVNNPLEIEMANLMTEMIPCAENGYVSAIYLKSTRKIT